MKIVGLSGQSGSGKTTVLSVFLEKGCAVCDCDVVSREVMAEGSECSKEIVSVFGDSILSENRIDRKKLGEIVFSDKEKLEKLTEISHRYIKKRIFEMIESAKNSGESVFVIDAPLLFESGLDKICDLTVALTAPEKSRIERIVKRDNISIELAKKRIASQLSEEKLKELSDCVIVNDKGIEELKKETLDLIQRKGILK